MSQDRRALPKCSDLSLIAFVGRIEKELGFSSIYFYLHGSQDPVNIENYSELFGSEIGPEDQNIARVTASMHVARHNAAVNITFARGTLELTPNGHPVEIPSLYNDNIQISPQHLDPVTAAKFNSIIADELLSKNMAMVPAAGTSDLSSLVILHHEILAAQRYQITSISAEFTKSRIAMEEEVSERKQQLQIEFNAQETQLQKKIEEEIQSLEEKKADLAKKLTELDDRNNTHVRRQLRQDLKERLASYKEKFELTEGTKKLRTPVLVCVITIEVFCVSAFIFLFQSVPLGGDVWDRAASWLKGLGLTFVAVATAVWYLKWLTQWSARHADAEFQLKQFELDIDRASWVVETAFEWKSTQEASIPQPLLDAISRNLFEGSDARRDRPESPIDNLASALLGDASKLKFKIGDQEIELDRSAIKRASKPLPN